VTVLVFASQTGLDEFFLHKPGTVLKLQYASTSTVPGTSAQSAAEAEHFVPEVQVQTLPV
jgi:hypothetical protein